MTLYHYKFFIESINFNVCSIHKSVLILRYYRSHKFITNVPESDRGKDDTIYKVKSKCNKVRLVVTHWLDIAARTPLLMNDSRTMPSLRTRFQ